MDVGLLVIGFVYIALSLGILSALLSAPAFYRLKKRKQIYIFEYGSIFYVLILFVVLDSIYEKYGLGLGISNLCVEPIIIALFGIFINYIRLFFPSNWSRKSIAAYCLVILFIVNICIYFFVPHFGE